MSDSTNPTADLAPVAPAAASTAPTTAAPDAGAAALAALARVNEAQLATLTAEQRAAVTKLAGGDQVRLAEALSLAPVFAPPRQTAAMPNAPAAINETSTPTDHKAIWAELKEINPVAAARYAINNRIFDR